MTFDARPVHCVDVQRRRGGHPVKVNFTEDFLSILQKWPTRGTDFRRTFVARGAFPRCRWPLTLEFEDVRAGFRPKSISRSIVSTTTIQKWPIISTILQKWPILGIHFRKTLALLGCGDRRGNATAEDTNGTPTQSPTSPSMLVYKDGR